LGEIIARQEGLDAELERIVPTGDHAIPYVWVSGSVDELDSLTATLRTSDKTEDVTVLDDLAINDSEQRQYLYRIRWKLDELDIIRGIVESGGAILEGETLNSRWRLRFRFEAHSDVADFYQFLADNGITDFSIESIYELEQRAERDSTGMSEQQREALVLAAEHGYFEIPRTGTLQTVGEELGISQQAASERVRRGVRAAVFDTLNIPDI
jgi:predicted DNA binding protein